MASEPFIGEIFMWAGNFAMRGTAFCNGQIMAIAQNTALFSLLGTTYGGNGTSTFALPNMIGNVPVGKGDLIGGSSYDLGQNGGSSGVTLLSTEIPVHNHNNQLTAAMDTGAGQLTSDPTGAYPAAPATTNLYSSDVGPGFMAPLNSNMAQISEPQGGGQPHNNLQPYLAVTFVIAIEGIFPARN